MNRDDNRIVSFLGFIFLSTILIYLPTLNAQFLNWDDQNHIILNEATRGLSLTHLKLAFTQAIQSVYMPLTTLTWAIERTLFGLDPFVFHLTNVIIHAINACGVMWLALRLGIRGMGPLIAALLFAWHPMKVESVAWVTERKDVLCAFFYILTLLAWHSYRITSRRKFYLLALALTTCALLAKPMAISIPIILLLWDWFLTGKIIRRQFIDKIPVMVLSIGIGWLTYQHHMRMPIDHLIQNALIFFYTALFYPITFILPINLTPFHTLPHPIAWSNGIYSLSALLMLIVIISLWVLRRYRWYIFAMLFWMGSMFFLWRYDEAHDINIVADRFFYIPSIGICLALGYAYQNATVRRALLIWSILIVMALLSARQVRYWHDSFTLYNYVLSLNPTNTIALNNRGEAWYQRKQYARSIDDYNQVLTLKPNDADTLMNRGLSYQALNQHEHAIEDFDRVIQLFPHYARAYNQRGVSYLRLKQLDRAMIDFNQTIQLSPDYAHAYINKGLIFQQTQRNDEAIEQYTKALAIDPTLVSAYNNRGVLLAQRRLFDQARHDFKQVLHYEPTNRDAVYNLNVIEHLKKD